MKDETIIFKHSGAGTGFYGGADWTCNHLQGADHQIVKQYFQGD